MMTRQTTTSTTQPTLIDGIVERQRRGLTLDTVFAMLIALAMVLSVVGLRSAGVSSTPSLRANDVSLPAGPAAGCVTDITRSSDLTC